MAKIGFLCGSLREGSINQKLQGALMHRYAQAGFDVDAVDLGEYPLPIYHGDAGSPEALQPLIDRLNTFDGVVVVTPEYNGGLPALLKNSIDWITTVSTEPFKGAVWGVAACTPGPLSGVVCMRELALLLMRIGGQTCPTFIGVGNAGAAFDADGLLHEGIGADLANRQVEEMGRAIDARGAARQAA